MYFSNVCLLYRECGVGPKLAESRPQQQKIEVETKNIAELSPPSFYIPFRKDGENVLLCRE